MGILPGKTILGKTRPPHYNPSFTPDAAPSAATVHGPLGGGPEDYGAYKLILLKSDAYFPIQTDTFFSVAVEETGDHLYVAEINGPDPWYVRIGPHTNPWIRLRQGMNIQREFRSLVFAITRNNSGSVDTNTTAILYTSRGSLVEQVLPNRYGARSPLVFAMTVSNTSSPIFTTIPAHHVTMGKDGGFMMLTNNDVINTIYISYDQLGAFGQSLSGTPIYPGQMMVMPLDNPMNSGIFGWQAVVASGTADMRVILSSGERDLLDPTQLKPTSMS